MNLLEAIEAAKAGKIVKVKYNDSSAIWHSSTFVWSGTKSPVHIRESNLEGWSVVGPTYEVTREDLYEIINDRELLDRWLKDRGIKEIR